MGILMKTTFAAIFWCALLLSGPAAAQGAAKGAAPSDEWKALIQEATNLFFEGKFDGGVVVAKKALGGQHPSVAATLEKLAAVYASLNKTAEAKQSADRAAAIRLSPPRK